MAQFTLAGHAAADQRRHARRLAQLDVLPGAGALVGGQRFLQAQHFNDRGHVVRTARRTARRGVHDFLHGHQHRGVSGQFFGRHCPEIRLAPRVPDGRYGYDPRPDRVCVGARQHCRQGAAAGRRESEQFEPAGHTQRCCVGGGHYSVHPAGRLSDLPSPVGAEPGLDHCRTGRVVPAVGSDAGQSRRGGAA